MTTVEGLDPLVWLDEGNDDVDARALLERREWVVPVLGAGISRGAGIPMSAELAAEMLAWDDAPDVDSSRIDVSDVRHVADAFGDAGMSLDVIKQRLADRIRAVELQESATTRAIGRVRSRIVVTLNWDHSIEERAEADGTSARAIILHAEAVEEAVDAIRDPGDAVSVIHVHGSVDEPATLVLDRASYQRLWDSRAVHRFFTVLMQMRRLCFMGTKLDELQILNKLFEESLGGQDHVFVGDRGTCHEVTAGRASLTHVPRLVVRSYPDPDGTHEALAGLANYIVAEPPEIAIPDEPRVPAAPPAEPLFVPPTLVPTRGADEEDELVQSLLVAAGEQRPLSEADLVRVGARTVISGAPGIGKSTLLRRIGAESGETLVPLLIRLSSVSAVGEPSMLLQQWAEAGEGLRGDEPVSSAALSQRGFLFLLDGLDEVPRAAQERLADKIVQVAAAHPGHAFTVASRPIGALSRFVPPEWQHVSLATGPEWRRAYLSQRGTDWEELVGALPELDDLRDLLDIPFFLKAVVDLHEEGRLADADSFPGVVEALVSTALGEAAIPLPTGPALEWLRRVAVTLLLSERTEATVDELSQIQLPAELQEAGDTNDVCELLVTARVFTGRGDGRFGFIHRIIGETLAAQLLAEHEPEEHHLLDAIAPCLGERVCGVRSDWLVAVTLAGMRSVRWRDAVRSRDALAAARMAPSDAPVEERQEAARTIWATYELWEIWIWDYRQPSLVEDADVLARLLRTEGMEPVRAEIVAGLESAHRETRGNAMRVLALAGDPCVEPFLREALEREQDPTLRRVAAVSARLLEASRLFHLVAHRATHPASDLEAQDMALVAADLASDEELLPFSLRLAQAPGASPYLVVGSVRGRLATRHELRFLREWAAADASPIRGDKERFAEIAETLDPADDEIARDVGFVAAAWKVHDARLAEFVRANPSPALSGMLAAVAARVAYDYELAAFVDWLPLDVLEAEAAMPEHLVRLKRQRLEEEASVEEAGAE